jgi:hypothetical protein
MESQILNNKTYPPVGYCIYCGATEGLRVEHILPFGLQGTAKLPQSSCGKCAKITGQQEQIVLRGSMWPVRVYRQLKSRTKYSDAPSSYPVNIVRNGVCETVYLPVGEYPILLNFPVFPEPAAIRPYPDGFQLAIKITGHRTVSFGPTPEQAGRKLGASEISISCSDQPVAFAKVMAKIAFAFASAEGKLQYIRGNPLVLPALLGECEEIGRWVGTATTREVYPGLLHRILIHEDHNLGFLIGEVHLFSDSHSPSYLVVLGELM